MRIYPAVHYTMGGLWVDYNLMSTIPGLFVLGEANFSDHGANRLGRLRAHAGPRRRLLRHPVHDRQLPRADEAREGRRPTHPEFAGAESEVDERTKQAARRSRASAPSTRSTASSARSCGRTAAWRATTQGLEDALAADPGAARGVLEERQRAGQRRRAQPVAREGRPRGRLPRARRADVPRRARARRVLRRPLPRGVPDRRRRGAARRRELLPRRGLGVHGRRQQARCCTWSRSRSSTSTWRTRSYK